MERTEEFKRIIRLNDLLEETDFVLGGEGEKVFEKFMYINEAAKDNELVKSNFDVNPEQFDDIVFEISRFKDELNLLEEQIISYKENSHEIDFHKTIELNRGRDAIIELLELTSKIVKFFEEKSVLALLKNFIPLIESLESMYNKFAEDVYNWHLDDEFQENMANLNRIMPELLPLNGKKHFENADQLYDAIQDHKSKIRLAMLEMNNNDDYNGYFEDSKKSNFNLLKQDLKDAISALALDTQPWAFNVSSDSFGKTRLLDQVGYIQETIFPFIKKKSFHRRLFNTTEQCISHCEDLSRYIKRHGLEYCIFAVFPNDTAKKYKWSMWGDFWANDDVETSISVESKEQAEHHVYKTQREFQWLLEQNENYKTGSPLKVIFLDLYNEAEYDD